MFKLVFLILDGPFKSPRPLRRPFPELAFPKVCSMEHEAQKFEERVPCQARVRTYSAFPSEMRAHLL